MPSERPKLYDVLKSVQPEDLSENAWASRAGVSRNFFQSLKAGSTPRSDTLERVIVAIGMTPAQFYDLLDGRKLPAEDGGARIGLPFQRRDEPLDIPLMGTAQGSDVEINSDGSVSFVERMDLDMSEVVEYLRRPSSLVGRHDVYAITVIGNSVAPRYEDGDPAYIDPRRQPVPGDYVVVQLIKPEDDHSGDKLHIALLKKLVRRTSTYIELCQHEPEMTFRVPQKMIRAIHRVIPWKEVVFF